MTKWKFLTVILPPTDNRPVGQPVLVTKTRFLRLSEIYEFAPIGSPLWREYRSVASITHGPRQCSHSMAWAQLPYDYIRYSLDLQGHVLILMPPDMGFPFHRLLRLARPTVQVLKRASARDIPFHSPSNTNVLWGLRSSPCFMYSTVAWCYWHSWTRSVRL
jgi:hypothetical protein